MFSLNPRQDDKLQHWDRIIANNYLSLPIHEQQADFKRLFQQWNLSQHINWTTRLCSLGQFCARCTAVLNSIPIPTFRSTLDRTRVFQKSAAQVHQAATVFQKLLSTMTKIRLFDSILVWIRGRAILVGMEWHAAWCRTIQAWLPRFAELQVNHLSYTHKWFNSKFVVYVMVSVTSSKEYIGSTSVTVSGRHQTRKRKLKQLERQEFVSCELALRYWSRSRNFQEYCPIVYRSAATRELSLAQEAADISTFQPKLNAPFMSAEQVLGKNRAFHEGISYFVPQRRMLIRVRHRQHKEETTGDRARALQKTTRMLYNLGSGCFRRFEQMRQLWGKSHTNLELLTLVRMCHNIDEPFRSRAQRALSTLLKRRNKQWPAKPFPLILPFLCNPEFKHSIQEMLRAHLIRHKEELIPLHWPPIKILEGKHQQLGDALYNWQKWQREFLIDPPGKCRCTEFLEKYRTAPTVKGHIAGPAVEFPFDATLSSILTASAKDSYYPAKEQYIRTLTYIFEKWCKRNNNVPMVSVITLVNQIWPAHLQALLHRDACSFADVAEARQALQGFVVHCEDHEPTRFCIYCPIHYHQVMVRTFEDQSVFGKLKASPSSLFASFRQLVPQDLFKRYSWGLSFDSRLPTAYVLVKRKKGYEKARPIISYSGTICATLFSALGKTLMDLIPKTYPSNFGNRNIDLFFQEIHRYLSQGDAVREHRMYNDDLVGFFVSVPHERIEAAIIHFISTYFRNWCKGQNLEDVKFTINTSKLAKFRTIRGRAIKANNKTFVVFLEDIPNLVKFSLKTSFFEALGKCYFQERGSPIGSQCSPAICAIVVAHKEVLWQQSYDVTLHSAGLFLRYVDNRLICLPAEICALTEYRQLTDLNFYLHPVQLEECGTFDVLGFQLLLPERRCKFKFPSETHQFRSPRSAGSQQKILSGYQSRLHLIVKRTWPQEEVRRSVQTLVEAYKKKGFETKLLVRISRRILHSHLFKMARKSVR